jgi:serine/threonine protein kinase
MSNLPKGTLVDHYVIQQVLTQGGFAWAYFVKKSTEPEGPEYFLKELFNDSFVYRVGHTVQLLKPEYQKQWEICLDGFVKELNVLSTLEIANIPKVIDAFEANNTFYIVQEKVNGITLDKWYREHIRNAGSASNEILLTLLIRLLQTLDGLHKFHKLHRDIKPSNILVDEEGQPYLVDFGAARLEIDSVTMNLNDRAITTGFASFELANTSDNQMIQGAASDIYSVAATFFALLFNERPLDARSRVIKGEVVKDFVTLSKVYDKQLMKSFNKAYGALPHSRFQNIGEWLNELELISNRLGIAYSFEEAEPEYHFEVGRNQGTDPNKHRVVLGSSSKVSGRHIDVSMVTKNNNTIEMTITDRSSNGTNIIAQTSEGEIVESLTKDEPVGFIYSGDCIIQMADSRISLRELLVTYARETKASHIEKLINEIESGAQTQIMQPINIVGMNLDNVPDKSDDGSVLPSEPNDKLTWKQVLFSFDGTISRSTFWLSALCFNIVSMIVIAILYAGYTLVLNSHISRDSEMFWNIILVILLLIVLFVNIRAVLALYYKRLRQTGLSKGITVFWMFAILIPGMSLIPLILAGFFSKDAFNEVK